MARNAAAQVWGAAGGRARAARLPRERRHQIAREAATARWSRDGDNAWQLWPRRRIALADFLSLPTAAGSGGLWRTIYRGRACLVDPDFPQMGKRLLPVILFPASKMPVEIADA